MSLISCGAAARAKPKRAQRALGYRRTDSMSREAATDDRRRDQRTCLKKSLQRALLKRNEVELENSL